jgi:exodeoxyribonuclease-3
MKITTWNVNGLRAALNKGLLDWVKSYQPDVLCLQEIKARPEQLEAAHQEELRQHFPQQAWNPAQRPGYSGVATLSRNSPLESSTGLGDPAFDGEGRTIVTRYPGFRLYNLYVPNGQHDHGRVPYKLDFYQRLLDQCDALHAQGENIILCGDFNTAHRPIDLKNPKQNESSTGFLPEERAWIDKFLEHGFVDIYRSLFPERVQYTWWTYRMNARVRNIGWRLDYFLVSPGLAGQVQDAVIHDEVPGADHCPVSLVFETRE